MIVLFIALWAIAAILIFTDPKTPSTRWGSGTAFFSGFGGLAVVLRDNILPLTNDSNIRESLRVAIGVMFTLSHQVAPYALMMYGITYSGVFRRFSRFLKLSPYIFFIPVAIMYMIYPFIPDYKPPFLVLSVWVVPYVMISNLLLLYAYSKENNMKIKQQKLLSCIIIAPTTLFSMMVNYIFRIFHNDNLWQYNIFTIALIFTIFVFTGVKYGVMGVQLKFEKQRLDSAMKAMTSGTAILNHTIKNEVTKISMCMNNIKYFAADAGQNTPEITDMNENIKIVLDSTSYLTVMINKIQNQVRDIVLEEHQNSLGSIIDKASDMAIPFTKGKNINIVKNYTGELNMYCDSVHLQETFSNIFNNAIEAIGSDGEIKIDIFENNKLVTVAVKDNGSGISKENLPHVIDPFFSTKNHRTQNFGLGLSYCYGVMQQHGGTLEVQSEEGIGTTVLLSFPAKRVLREKYLQNNLGVENVWTR